MDGAYAKIVHHNLSVIFQDPKKGSASLSLRAFGKGCAIRPDGIFIEGNREEGVIGILISLYLLNAGEEEMVLEPFKAFQDLPNSAPYVSAFAARSQQVLVPHVEVIRKKQDRIIHAFGGSPGPAASGGDFSFVLYPFPKIALCYIFYRADEDFPASATCLFSSNALSFAPIDALADTAEYTSKAIIQHLELTA